jgi:hypothetical protein
VAEVVTVVAETWMPVSGTFRAYALEPVYWHWEDGPVVWSKGHHDPQLFLHDAIEAWRDDDDSTLTIYDGTGWEDCEGPVWPPAWLRSVERVEHEWWANRQNAWGEGYSYYVEPGPCWRRGAYPVTVVQP